MKRPCDKQYKMHFGYGIQYPPELRWVTKDGKHHGYDYLTPLGCNIYSPCEGVLTMKEKTPKAGLHVAVKFWRLEGLAKTAYRFTFMHLSKAIEHKKIGDTIMEGEVIGVSGDSGSAKGHPHLHLGLERYDSKAGTWAVIDPILLTGLV